jgi:predicted Zn-ribbon and HTH transcriptional regulator
MVLSYLNYFLQVQCVVTFSGVYTDMNCIQTKDPSTKPKYEVADIFNNNLHNLTGISKEQWQVVNALVHCRTAELGGHKLMCLDCGYEEISYNSCRNRHCPKCQAHKRMQWVSDRVKEMLPVKYFHVVFTIPDILNHMVLQNKKEMYDILFRSVKETLIEATENPKNLGAKIGFIAILHTWGQNLLDHPHIHCVVTGGGLSKDRKSWIRCKGNNFFIAIKILKELFKNKYLYYLTKSYKEKRVQFHGQLLDLGEEDEFARLLGNCYKKTWVVNCKKPFGNPSKVLKYIGRYTHRVAISNNRIVSIDDGKVSFTWKDYRDNKNKIMTLTASEFMRRFLLHVLPKGFKKIRFYGILSNGNKTKNLKLIRLLLSANGKQSSTQESLLMIYDGHEERTCPKCKSKNIRIFEVASENDKSMYCNSA